MKARNPTDGARLSLLNLLTWLRTRDAGLAALRRAGRTAIVMPSMFAIGTQVLDNATLATFAAFGSFAMLLFIDFGGPMRERLAAQTSLVVVGTAFVCLGTFASRSAWLAVPAMVIIGFVVLFAGVVSSVLAGATTAVLLAFILPVTMPGPVDAIPDRIEGWLLAGAASLLAVTVLWPAPTRDPLRHSAATACRLVAHRLQTEVGYLLSPGSGADRSAVDAAVAAAVGAVEAMRTTFFATPYRPTGLTTSARTVVRLVDELVWLDAILDRLPPGPRRHPVDSSVCAVKSAAATLLEHSAVVLDAPRSVADHLDDDLRRLARARDDMELAVTSALPVGHASGPVDGSDRADSAGASEFVSSLEPSFRAQEMSFAISAIAANIATTAAAQRRPWRDQLLGRQPA